MQSIDWQAIGVTVLIWIGVLALLVVVWLLIEGTRAIKQGKESIKNLEKRLNPTLANLETITSSIQPAIERLDPILQRATLTVDTVNLELMRVDQILEDLNSVTRTIDTTVNKVNTISALPMNFISDAADKIRDIVVGKPKTKSEIVEQEVIEDDSTSISSPSAVSGIDGKGFSFEDFVS